MKRHLQRPSLLLRAILAILLTSGVLHSAPHSGETYTYTQPDGETFKVRLYGDEFFAYQETEEGYLVIRDKKNGFFCYASVNPDESDFISTGVKVGQQKPSGLKRKQRLARGMAMKKSLANRNFLGVDTKGRLNRGKKLVADKGGKILNVSLGGDSAKLSSAPENGDIPQPSPPSTSTLNKRVGLVLLASFPDRPGDVTKTVADIDNYCNAEVYTDSGNATSVYSYFKIQSNGKLEYKNNVTAWFTAANPRSYYTDNTVGYRARAKELINEGLAALTAQGFDFTQCDGNNDGQLDGINCFYAGSRVNAWSEGIWPHQSASFWTGLEGSGLNRTYSPYQITDMPSNLPIGTFCHENGHMICGFPDLYSYGKSASNLGSYSLMSSSSSASHPMHIDPYLKIHAGWADVIDITSTSHQLCAVQQDRNFYYRYRNPAKAEEYFLFEVRGDDGYEGAWGGAVSSYPTDGLVIYHVNEKGSNTNSTIVTADSPNADYTRPYEAMVVEANPSSATNPWYDAPSPGFDDGLSSSGLDSISDNTMPALKFWANNGRTVVSGADVHSISATGKNMTFIIGSGALTGNPATNVTATQFEPKANFGGDADNHAFAVFNSGGGTLTYTITDNATWLNCSVANGTATNEADSVTVTYNTSTLAPGNYTATITVDGSASNAGTKTINVSLTVYAAPTLDASPGLFSLTGSAGTPGSKGSFNLRNLGGGTADYTIANTKAWLSLGRTDGAVSIENDLITLSCDAANLLAGIYNDTITITSPSASNSPLTIPVTFTVGSTDMLITAPNGGEQWRIEATHNITWVSDLGGSVKIELIKNGSVTSPPITNETPNDGSFAWTIPSGLTSADDYKVKITSIDDPTKTDQSNLDFSISIDLLASALDTTGLAWQTSGGSDWFPQTGKTHDGVDAAQSGNISDNETTSMKTNLTGPGKLTFWWKVSSESNYDYLLFYLNDVEQTGSLKKISGDVDWVKKTVTIPAGSHTVKWSYKKDGSSSSLDDAAWVDQVVFSPENPYVKYYGNGNDTGSTPVDSNQYAEGTLVTVLLNSGNLVKSGYVFSGWNTLPDGTGTHYSPTDTFNIGASNVSLYAKWITLYEDWSNGADLDDDNNNDGIPNGIAWVLGASDPSVDATALLPTINTTDNHFIFTYRRSDNANTAPNTAITIQYGSNLSGWTNASSGPNVTITESNDFYGEGVDKVEVKINLNLAPEGLLFGRLKLNITPVP